VNVSLIVQTHVLLHEDRVRARRQGGAGENPPNGADGERVRNRSTGRKAPIHRQGSCRLQVREANGVAIDGRVVEGWQIDWRNHVLRQHAAIRFEQTHMLDAVHTRHAGRDHFQRGIDGQKLTAKGEAVIRELRHRFL
jgi:hypothetical protein